MAFGEVAMSILHRKSASDVYAYAGVSPDNETAASIQHNIDLLRYLAGHPHFTKRDLASYLDILERYGIGLSRAARDEHLAIARSMTREQAIQMRLALASVHLEALTDNIRELGKGERPVGGGKAILEKAKMVQFAVEESEKTRSAFM
jgi:hypothetical protein